LALDGNGLHLEISSWASSEFRWTTDGQSQAGKDEKTSEVGHQQESNYFPVLTSDF
jgi:hypothetical protein